MLYVVNKWFEAVCLLVVKTMGADNVKKGFATGRKKAQIDLLGAYEIK
jgi:hypothetical protein